jgi:hypothetical protein
VGRMIMRSNASGSDWFPRSSFTARVLQGWYCECRARIGALRLNGSSDFHAIFENGPIVRTSIGAFYDTHYDMDILKALARKRGRVPVYRIHPAFWPALCIQAKEASKEPQLL